VLQQGLNELHVRAHLFVRLPNVACVFREELKNLAAMRAPPGPLVGSVKRRVRWFDL
jgi:hypothetical protein